MAKILPYQGGFHGFQTISNHYNDNDDAVDNVEDDDNDDMMMMMMMTENTAAMDIGDSIMNSRSSGSKSSWKKLKHAKSEQKRRQRINSHHATLRHLFPNLLKKDKASLLKETVRRVRELRKMVDEIACRKDEDSGGADKAWLRSLPSENDEATVSYSEGGNNGTKRVTMTVCCEDSPSLNWELMDAIRTVKGRAVKAELSTIGGRTKAVVVVEWRESDGGGEEDVGSLRRALRGLVENQAFDCHRLTGHANPDTNWADLAQELLNSKQAPVSETIQDGLAQGLIAEGLITRSGILNV